MSSFYDPIPWGSINPPKVIILYGKEGFYKEREVQRAKNHFESFDFTEMEIEGSDESVAKLRNKLGSGNIFFDTQEFLVLRDVDRLSDPSVLENYCSDQDDSKIVLGLSQDKSRISKWLRRLDADISKECEEIKSYKLSDWVQSFVKRRGYKMKDRHAQAVVRNVGESLHAITNELEKIFIHTPKSKGMLEKEDITSVLHQHSEMNQFDIVEKWAVGEKKTALHLTSIHYEKSSRDPTLKLLASFLHSVKDLIYIRSARTNGQSKSKIQSYIGKPPFIMKKLYRQASNWEVSTLESVYSRLSEIDYLVKTGSNGRVLMENFIVSDFTEQE